MIQIYRLAAVTTLVLLSGRAVWGQPAPAAAVFESQCATCHSGASDSRAPGRESLAMGAPETIVRALTTGTMQAQGAGLSVEERRALAEFLAGRTLNDAGSVVMTGRCAASPPLSDPDKTPRWNGWGVTVTNTRFQPAAQARLTASDVPKLKLKWAFGFPDATSAWSQPASPPGDCSSGARTATCTPSLRRPAARTGRSRPVRPCAARLPSRRDRPAQAPGAYSAYFGDMQ